MPNPLEALRNASSIGPDKTTWAYKRAHPLDRLGDPAEVAGFVGSIGEPHQGVVGALKGLLGWGAGGAAKLAGEAIVPKVGPEVNKMTPSLRELKELFPTAQGVLGDPIEQGRQRMFQQRWQMPGAPPRTPPTSFAPPSPTASFLGHGPEGPLYNVEGGPMHRSTVSAQRLTDAGIQIPHTPAPGAQLNGEQLRAQALAARKKP